MSFHKKVLIIAIIWYSITAYFSIGYFHPDEHYQIVEFAGILNETNTPDDLPWEYKAKIRSTLQPTLAYIVFEVCDFFSIYSPYSKLILLRLLTAFLALSIISIFVNSCRKLINKKYWNFFVITSYFLWFLPFLNVRFSSETLSGLSLLLASSFILRNNRKMKSLILIGLLLGLSFLFRFQTAIAAIGIVLWLFLIKKEKIVNLLILISSAVFVLFLGFFIDSWFYSEYVLTFWSYFKVNLLEGKASSFGIEPWYYYIKNTLLFSFFPVGILLISSILFLFYKKPKNIFLWIILPFIIIHTIIPHKELRFLFPIINFLPIILILAFQEINWSVSSSNRKQILRLSLIIVMIANFFGLIITGLNPAYINSRVKITQKIESLTSNKLAKLYFVNNSNPFNPWNLTTNFYSNPNIKIIRLQLPLASSEEYKNGNQLKMLVINLEDQKNSNIQEFIIKNNFKEICKSVPEFSYEILSKVTNKSNKILILYSNEPLVNQ